MENLIFLEDRKELFSSSFLLFFEKVVIVKSWNLEDVMMRRARNIERDRSQASNHASEPFIKIMQCRPWFETSKHLAYVLKSHLDHA